LSVYWQRRSVQFLLLTIAATAALFARTAVSPLQETMRIALSLSDNQMAVLQGPALALPVVLAAIPLGLLIDRYSRVRLLFIFAVSAMVGTVLTALASHFAVLFLARCLIGLTVTATGTAAFSLLADLYAPAQRGRASMMVVIGQFAGMAAAFALGGALLAMTGSAPNGWRWAMLWLAAPLVAVIFLILAMREPPRTGVALQNPSAREAFAELWRYRAVIAPLMAGLIMAEIAVGAVLVWAAPTLSRSFALAPDRIGAIMFTVVLTSGILGSITGGVLADLCQRAGGPRRTMSALGGLALLTVPAGFFAVVPGVGPASVLLFILMTIVGAILVTAVALFTIVIPNELRGLCLSAMTGANVFFGVALAPVTVSLLSGAIGGPATIGRALAIVCVAAGLLGAATFAFGRRYFPGAAMQ
jgi:MFS family permease